MPWFEIPPEQLTHLTLFGYDKLADGANTPDFEWYAGPLGRTRVQTSKPVIWLEDVSDGMQLRALAVHHGPKDTD